MRRRAPAVTALMAVVGASLFLLAPPASAQTGYPPGDCTVTLDNVGNLATGGVGQTLTLTVQATCVFTAGATANVTVNGQSAGTKTINADGSVTVTVNILSTTQLSVNPTVTGQCGSNSLEVNGPSGAVGGSSTVRGSFTVTCPSAAATPVRGRVAFTGSNILNWALVALALVAIGGGLVMAERRRSRKRA